MRVLAIIERALGSSTLSLVCFCAALVGLGVPVWVGVLLLIPFNNYAHKLEELSPRKGASPKAETSKKARGAKRVAPGPKDAPNSSRPSDGGPDGQ